MASHAPCRVVSQFGGAAGAVAAALAALRGRPVERRRCSTRHGRSAHTVAQQRPGHRAGIDLLPQEAREEEASHLSPADTVWYAAFHAWRTWFFTTAFLLTFAAARGFSFSTVLWVLVGHPGFYLTFFAISKGVYDADLRCMSRGQYKMPYDASLAGISKWMQADRLWAYIQDVPQIAARASRDGWRELPAKLRQPGCEYPAYYLRNFHYQTDGWLSEASAQLYEVSTEVLFTGTQDAMQRLALAAIHSWRRGRGGEGPMRLLEAGCGTGRLLCQIAENWPDARLTALDLSPYYLDACRASHAEWGRGRPGAPAAAFLAANVEELPLADRSVDVVVCAYVFHELPPSAREAAAAEFHRVLRPGGLCVLLDSAQAGDLGPDMDGTLEWFPKAFHEPYYRSWLRLSLDGLFVPLGFAPFTRGRRHVTKMASWRKLS